MSLCIHCVGTYNICFAFDFFLFYFPVCLFLAEKLLFYIARCILITHYFYLSLLISVALNSIEILLNCRPDCVLGNLTE